MILRAHIRLARVLLGPAGPPRRSASTSSRPEDDPFTAADYRIRSPKDLFSHLSQYIVGQDRAKRILSVAVFNHYQRIAPRLKHLEEKPEPPSPPPRAKAPLITLETPVPNPPSPRQATVSPSVSTRLDKELQDAVSWDPSRVTGTGMEGGAADPTLTHDLLTLRSREGQWARSGFFDSRPPPLPSLLGQAIKRRKGSGEDVASTGKSRKKQASTSSATQGGVSGQSAAVKRKDDVVIEKSNVLMIGPTGTGKTLMAKTLANILDVPFVSCDATAYTQAGYVGEDVENCVLRLLQASNYDIDRTELGIIHIDEIDKLARRGGGGEGSWGGGRDVGGEGVQQALLRLLEGTTLTLTAKPPPVTSSASTPTSSSTSPTSSSNSGPSAPSPAPKAELNAKGIERDPPGWNPNDPTNRGLGSGKRSVREGLPGYSGGGGGADWNTANKGDTFVVDTSNILFVLSGAFVGLEQIVNRRLGKGSIGFGAPLPKSQSEADQKLNPIPLKGLSTPDLTTYGLIPEFLGRLPTLTTLHPLSILDLVHILNEPKNALLKQYEALFEKYGSELKFTKKAIEEVARTALERGGGARGLRGVLEEVLVDCMFEVPGSSVRYCLITAAVIRGEEQAFYFSRGQKTAFYSAIEAEDGPAIREGHEAGDELPGASVVDEGMRAVG
ncbi:ATP-dependent Clp protease ATP-binding subunit ClpX [Cryptococcus wingfieldii CBS 7118]|uniref:ATP-dependent Clp protease ATP-binding subunit ClpX n=1 Tax=Cryptococcus wingfieldii CBS 7118 TaxID=1295528 RepID=A0A1E3JWC0_9TREE|nr:ATP-dependent Clp protease ATP-binding subunit ClpX [Cryptococcus wingfieldii CBS 7118]ODO05093.1 ATP-dependent Clp protease ATP-binding subunit ClpX [Cryptococcus wingfieldii CBS 7118]